MYLSWKDVQENHVCFHLKLLYDSQLLSIIETGYIPYVTCFWSIPDLYTVTILFLYFPSLNKGKKCEVWFVLITNIIDWSVTALWLKARKADFGWVLHNSLRSILNRKRICNSILNQEILWYLGYTVGDLVDKI